MEPCFAKTSTNASYVRRSRGGGGVVRQVPTSSSAPSTSSLKVKQYLNQVAKQERAAAVDPRYLRRSASLDAGNSSSRIFEYRIDSNKMAEKAFDSSRGYVNSSEPVIKPIALKPLVLSHPDVSLSRVLASEVFTPGTIPSNREIDHIVELIKRHRTSSTSDEEMIPSARPRRHSDISDLRSGKRRIKDRPSSSSSSSRGGETRRGSLQPVPKKFGSTNSAFSRPDSIQNSSSSPRLLSRCQQETIPEEETVVEPTERLYPVLSPLEDHMPEPPPVSAVTQPEKSRNSPSPDNSKCTREKDTRPKRRSSSSSFSSGGGFSVRNPTSQRVTSSSSDNSGPDDFVLVHTLMRKARHRHRKCSQPCMLNCSDEEDNELGVRYSPNTHPRAQQPAAIAACSGNHPPVSYLNSMKRSTSLQVNHITVPDPRHVSRFQTKKSSSRDQPAPASDIVDVNTSDTSQHSDIVSVEEADEEQTEDQGSTVSSSEIDQVKDLLKKVGRKYLREECVVPCKDPHIDKKNSLSFIFNGNKELQEKVRHFFHQTNKTYCKRLIKQRFESNPLDNGSPDSSIAGDLAVVRPLSEYAEVINSEIQNRHCQNVGETIHSYLAKSEGFVSNKCDNLNQPDKLRKSEDFLNLEHLKTPDLQAVQKQKEDPEKEDKEEQEESILPRSNTQPNRPKFNSANSDISDHFLSRNGSKASRDSGYGDSTSASNEGLNPPKCRTRSTSLTILSKLKPLFGLKKRDQVPNEQDNPFNRIFEDHPISELTKSLDSFIARRSSLPNTGTPDLYDPDVPVFDSPSDNLTPAEEQTPSDQAAALNQFNSLFGDVTSQIVTSSQIVESEDDESEFRVSPLPEDTAAEQGKEEEGEVCGIVRKSFDDLCREPYTRTPLIQSDKFSLQDIQEILDSYDVLQQDQVHSMLQSPLTIALSSIYHTLTNVNIPPNSAHNLAKATLEDMMEYLDERLEVEEDNEQMIELVGLLESFEDLVDLHDEIVCRSYYDNETLPEVRATVPPTETDAPVSNHSIYRMVGLHKNKGEPLGITLKKEDEKVVVHRILAGGMIDRQRLLHIGDVIISINGQDIQPKPDHIQRMLKDQEGDIHLKIIPSYREQAPVCQVYVKAHFSYDPRTDDIMPCKEAGLKFQEGDILQIVNQDDPNWWQAKLEGGEGQAGLIPGLILQEQRMASNGANEKNASSVGCGGASRKKKKNKKMNYSATKNSDFDQHELNLYEEVAKMPPFNRKTLVLIGAQGVGRRSLISKLVLNEPDKFGNTMPHTSRPVRPGERDGGGYWFTTREKMDEDIQNHKYLEYGEYEGHLYGTKLDSIRQVMRSGKMCLLDVNPQSLKVLKTPEFVPYIVFIEAPHFETLVAMHRESVKDHPAKNFSDIDLKKSIEESKRLKRQYSHYFDVIIQNNDMDGTYSKLYECISKLSTSPQWVPVSWVY